MKPQPPPIDKPRARLIVNADDFGLHSSINAAIIEGHRRGVITSCSLMPLQGAASFNQAVALAKSNPGLNVGLHFTLIGLPNLPSGYSSFLPAYFRGQFPPSRIELLLSRQIDLLESVGIRPSHIDSHQHLHALPGVMRSVCKVAATRGIHVIRLPLETAPTDAPPARIAAGRALGLVARRAERQITLHNLHRPDHFFGMAVSGHLTTDKLLNFIARIPDHGVTEILCHPGSNNAALAAEFDWGYDWEGELAAVTSERVRQQIKDRRIDLTTFGRMLRPVA